MYLISLILLVANLWFAPVEAKEFVNIETDTHCRLYKKYNFFIIKDLELPNFLVGYANNRVMIVFNDSLIFSSLFVGSVRYPNVFVELPANSLKYLVYIFLHPVDIYLRMVGVPSHTQIKSSL